MKRVLSLVLALVMVFGTIMPAFAEDAATTAADSQAAQDLVSYGVIAGTDKGLEEASVLTRAQMTVILSQLYGKKAEAEAYAFAPSFTDVEEGKWYTPYVAFAEQQTWMSGDAAGGTFRPDDVMKAQEVNAMFVKALGYADVDWADVNTKAEELEVAITAADATSVLRGEAFAALRATLDVPKMDETDTLGTALALTNYVSPTPAAPAAVTVTGAVSLNTQVIEVSLDSDLDAPTAVTADQFTVVDAADAAVAVAAVEFAPWDADNYTVLVTLETATTAGTLYTVTSGETSANFGGMTADTTKPTVTKIESADYNEVTITFSEAVKIDALTVELAEKYGDKAALAVTNIEYAAKDKVTLTTADQKASTLFTSTIEGAADLAGNVMAKDTAKTFVGKAKPTAKQTLNKAVGVTSTTVDVYFDQKVDEAAALEIANYTVAMKYGDKTEIAVLEAEVRSLTTAEKATWKAGQIVQLTLATDTTAATLYGITVENIGSVYGTVLASSQTKTFVGLAKDTTKLAAPVAKSTSNTTMTLTFGTADEKDYVNEATTADMITITEKYGDKAELAITDFSISKNVITLTTATQKSATLYEVVIATGLLDKAGNATTAELKTTVVGSGIATKITDITSAVLDSAGTTLTVTFNKNVDPAQAVDISHYVVDNGVGYPTKAATVSGAGNEAIVKLTLPKTTEGKIYKLTVTNLNNSDGVAMATDGVKETFVGKGNAATLPVIEAVLATDAQTIKVYFDRDVTGSDIAGKIWNSTSGAIMNSSLTYSVDGTNYIAIPATAKAYQDTAEDNVLVIRTTAAAAFKAATATTTDDTFKLKALKAYVKATDGADTTMVFAFNDTAAAAVEIISVMAVDNQTLRVYFNMPVQTPDATFAKVAKAAADTFATGTNLTLSNPTKYDGNAAIWNFKLSAAMTTNTSHYFLVDPTVTTAKLADTAAVVTVKDEDSSAANIQHEREFAGTSTAPTAITDVYAVMTDKRTIVVYYPEAMDSTTAKTLANYAVVKASTGLTADLATAQPVISADINTAKTEVTLHLGADIDTAATNVYLVATSDIKNATQSVALKADKTGLTAPASATTTGLVVEFAKSTGTPAGPSISTITLDDDRMGLTIKMDRVVAFDASPQDSLALDGDNTAEEDKFIVSTTTVTSAFDKTDFDSVFVINGQLVGDTAAGTITTATATRSLDGKSFHVTFASALKPSTEGYVTTEKASAVYMYDKTFTATAKTNADASKVSYGVPATASYDNTPATVTAISATDGSYKLGDVVNVEVVFSENVVVTGSPLLDLDTLNDVAYTSGSGTNKLVFAYTVAAGHTAADLDNVVNGLTLNGGTINDTNGTVSTITIANDLMGAANAVVIDTTAPVVANAVTQNNHATVITVTLTELNDLFIGAQKVNDAADHTASWTVTDTRSTLTAADVVVMSAAGSPVLSITLPDANTGVEAGSVKINLNQILDAAGNAVVNGTTPANTVLTITDGGATWSAAFGAN